MEERKWVGKLIDAPCGNTQYWEWANGDCKILLIQSHYHNRITIKRINSEERNQDVIIQERRDLVHLLDGLAKTASGTCVDFPLERHLRSLKASQIDP